MTYPEIALKRKIQSIALIGPLCLCLALILLVYQRTEEQSYLPLAGILCIGLCWRWKSIGFLSSTIFLASLFFFYFLHQDFHEALWSGGFSLAILLSCFTTFLSSEESEAFIDEFRFDSHQELKSEQQKLEEEKADALNELTATRNRCIALQEQLDSRLHLLQLAEEELASLSQKYETSRASLEESQKELGKSEQENQKLSLNVEELKKEIEQFHRQATEEKKAFQEIQEEQLSTQVLVQELNDHIETLDREKDLLEKTITHLQSEIELLHSNEEVNSKTIETYVATIHAMKEKEDNLQTELSCEKNNGLDLRKNLEDQELLFGKQLDEIGTKWFSTIELNNGLKESLLEKEEEIENLSSEVNRLRDSSERSPLQKDEGSSEFRRMKGMYLQLREQFEKKSLLLDSVRKELFLVNEELLALQKEQVQKVQGLDPELRMIQKQLLSTNYELEKNERSHENEIVLLESIISTLTL